MKRIFLLLLVFVLCPSFMTGCSKTLTEDLSVVLSDINTQQELDNMKILDDAQELYQRYLINTDMVKSFAVEFSTVESDFTELIFIEAVDNESADEISAVLDNYYRTKLDMAETYDADLTRVLEECSVKQRNVYVSLVISEDVKEIEKIYNSFFE